MMMMAGFGALAAALPAPTAWADPSRPAAPAGPTPAPAAPAAATGGLLFHDEFDGPAGSVPDPSKWQVSNHRTPIKNPVGFDRPQFFGQYRDSRQNVFLDGNSNLVLRATREGNRYFGGLVHGLWRGGIGTTWEARIKFNCLAPGMWPAWWLSNDDPGRSGEIDLIDVVWQRDLAVGNHRARQPGRHRIRDLPDRCGRWLAQLARHVESERHVLLAGLRRRH